MQEKELFKNTRRLLRSGSVRMVISYDKLVNENGQPFVSARLEVTQVEGDVAPRSPDVHYLGNTVPRPCVHEDESEEFQAIHRDLVNNLQPLLAKIADAQGNLYFRQLNPGFEVHHQPFQSNVKEHILLLFPQTAGINEAVVGQV